MGSFKIMAIMAFFLVISVSQVSGQDRYAVSFKFKGPSKYSLENPEAYLTQKALDRRAREGVAVDSTDLPVSHDHITTLQPLVDKIVYSTNWLNASVVIATEEQVGNVKELRFVEKVELVAPGFFEEGSRQTKRLLGAPIHISLKSSSEDDYALQNNLLGIPEMHAESLTGQGITIGVFDGGFLNTDNISGMKHLFENDQIIGMRDFVMPWSENVFRTHTHGTSSLSLIAANEHSTLVSGAFDASYILCITEDVGSEYRVEEYNWAKAAEYADSLGVDIINNSLGYSTFDDERMNYTKDQLDGETAVITKAAKLAAHKGILVVSSAGNAGGSSETTITAPADTKGILAVGAVTENLNRVSFSSVGPTADGRIKPDLMALGNGVRLWKTSNSTSTSSGTSFSAPQITALAAGIWQGRPHWTKDELIQYLLESGTRASDPDNEFGYGIPNFAVAYYGEITEIEKESELVKTEIYPNPTDGQQLFIRFGHEDSCQFSLFDINGRIISEDHLSRDSNATPYEIDLAVLHAGMYVIELNEGRLVERHKLLIR